MGYDQEIIKYYDKEIESFDDDEENE